MDTAFCAAPVDQRAAVQSDPLTAHGMTIEFEALLAAADALLGGVGGPSAWHTNTTVSKSSVADLRRAVTAARAVLNAEPVA